MVHAQVDSTIFIKVKLYQSAYMHIVWDMVPDGNFYTLEKTLDNINFTSVASIQAVNLTDIALLNPQNVNAYGSILYSTEGGNQRLIYNDNEPAQRNLRYRVKIELNNTSVVYTRNEFDDYQINDLTGLQDFIDDLITTGVCPPNGVPDPCAVPTNNIQTVVVACCSVDVIRYDLSTACQGNGITCAPNETDCIACGCGCTWDDCCVHHCATIDQCTCVPWPSCGSVSIIPQWVVFNTTPIVISVNVTSTQSCGSACNGSATATASGGTAPYSYAWSNGQTTSTITGLCAGNYTVTATDGFGCTGSATVTVTDFPEIILSLTMTESCNTPCSGTATVNASGGTAPFTYAWSPGGQTSQTATNLCAGSYTVTVTDANGCTKSGSITVSQFPTMTLSITTTDASCYDVCNGTAVVTVVGGTPPYNFLWSDGQTTATVTGLCPTPISVTVTDANGCTSTASEIINVGPGLQATISGTAETCIDLCDGSASVVVTTGTAPFTYNWSTGASTSSINLLCSGTYSVTILDANGCRIILVIDLISSLACDGCFTTTNIHPQTNPIPDQDCWWSTGGNSFLSVDGDNNFLGTTSNNATPLRLFTEGIERIHIDASANSGNVGIHTPTPGNTVEINSDVDDESGLRFTDLNSSSTTSAFWNSKVLTVDQQGDVILVTDPGGSGGITNTCLKQNFITKDDGTGNLRCSNIFNDNTAHVGVNTNNINQNQQLFYGFQNAGTGAFARTPPNQPYCTYNGTPPYPLMVETYDNIGRYYGLSILADRATLNPPTCTSAPVCGPPQDHLRMYVDNTGISFIETLGRPTVFRAAGCYGVGDLLTVLPNQRAVVVKSDVLSSPLSWNTYNRPRFYSELNTADGSTSSSAIWGNNISNTSSAWQLKIGVLGTSTGGQNAAQHDPNVGGMFQASGNDVNIGVWGVSPGTASFPNRNWAGYFDGDVMINGAGVITQGPWSSSDIRFKKDIQRMGSALERISKLNGYTYLFKTEEFPEKNFSKDRRAGLLAQEMKEVIPEAVQEMNDGYLAVNYDGVTALLIEAVKEQKDIIEKGKADVNELKEKVAALEAALAQCCSSFEDVNARMAGGDDQASLGQNVPNPFNENTSIAYYLPSTVKNASINVYTTDGQNLTHFDALPTGRGSVTVSSGVLAPGAYLYNLVADGKQIDSKWMIVTK